MNKFIAASMCLVIWLLPFAFADEGERSSNRVETSKPVAEQTYEVVNVESFLNIRSGPGTIYSILRAIPSTEKNITIVDSKELAKSTWVKIKHDDEYGWVNQVYLKPTGAKIEPTPTLEGEEEPLWLTMSGVYALTNIEPMKGQKMDTHMLFQVESEQAKVIYDAIKTPPFIDKCTGANAKKVGEMLCLHYPVSAEKRQKQKMVKQDSVITETEDTQTEDVGVVKDEVQQTQSDADQDVEVEREFFDASEEITDIYECHFSINIMQQKIQQGIPCEE